MKHFLPLLLLSHLAPSAFAQWQVQPVKVEADFRGLSVVGDKVAWVSGTKGTVGRTTDGGTTWQFTTVAGAEKLDFRDVEAFGETTAYALSIGPGGDSRIYKTTDGGKAWARQFQNADREAFYNALAFWDEKHGLALSDPVQGQYRLTTTDDGMTWKPLSTDKMPAAAKGEGAFAASGTCLVTQGDKDAWFVTGGGRSARVFHTRDRGQSWGVKETPIAGGVESAGAFSIAFHGGAGVVVGGDYRKPTDAGATAAVTADGGKTWMGTEPGPPFRSGVAWAKDRWVAVGTSGSSVSRDDGRTWQELDRENYNAVAFAETGEGWAVGPEGRIAKFDRGRAASGK